MLNALFRWAFRRSPWVGLLQVGGCNGCTIEVVDALTPRFDIERFGAVYKSTPRHVDILLVTGCVTVGSVNFLKRIYDQIPDPKVIVAVGTCAVSGGIFTNRVESASSYAVLGGIDRVIPVDIYVAGCPPKPEAIIDALLEAAKLLAEKRQ